MKHLSATARIAFSLACLGITLLMGAQLLGFFPETHDLIMSSRSKLSESIAVNFSLLAEYSDQDAMEASLRAFAKRNPEIQSLGVRHSSGEFLFQVGDHASNWKDSPTGHSTETHMYVPIMKQGKRWGTVEVCYLPISSGGIFSHPLVLLVVFMVSCSTIVFYLYLSKVLKQLNPTKVVPTRVKSALDTLAEGLVLLDPQGRIVLANQAFSTTTGQTLDSLMGRQVNDLDWRIESEGTNGDGDPKTEIWNEVLKDGVSRHGQLIGLSSQKNKTFVVNSASIKDDKGRQRGCITSFEDVTKLQMRQAELSHALETLNRTSEKIRAQNKELERLATRDPLTGCFNRRSFFEHFESYWSEANRHQDHLAGVMVDIDHFKSINDNHGHAVGDDVLRTVAACLQETARDYDIVARYGGEEFAILMPRTNLEEAHQAAERIRKAIEALQFPELSVTASLGISGTSQSPHSPQELLEQADQALYAAKHLGRNQAVRFDQIPEDMESQASDNSSQKVENAASSIPYPAVTALTSAMAYRDIETASHSRRVAKLCVAVGQGLMSMSSCYVLETAALLHDIGKIGVPDSILLKPTMLTPEEWEVMRRHDRIGVEIIRSSFGSEELSAIVENYRRHFSERMESGENIPLGARILAIADAYDSMVTDSCYRQGRTTEQAFEELRRCAGTQFDGEIVERFIEAVTLEQRQTPQTGVSREAVLSIGVELERLAVAVDQQDIPGLKAMASRLAETSAKLGAPEISAKAMELESLAHAKTDLLGILQSANQLLEVCRTTQDSFLDTVGFETTNEAQPPAEAVPVGSNSGSLATTKS